MQGTKVSSSGHSFKGMVDTKSIFVHVPKCAGVSISEALYGNLGGGHTTINEYLYIFSPAEIELFFKFTFYVIHGTGFYPLIPSFKKEVGVKVMLNCLTKSLLNLYHLTILLKTGLIQKMFSSIIMFFDRSTVT
jgi:hypothetical protein